MDIALILYLVRPFAAHPLCQHRAPVFSFFLDFVLPISLPDLQKVADHLTPQEPLLIF